MARLCATLDVPLHLVRPLGFEISDRHLRRAGLDYWPLVKLCVHDEYAALERALAGRRLCFATAFGTTSHWDFGFEPGDVLVFGKETAGLPRALWEPHPDRTFRIPHWGPVRSLNLSNAVAVAAYEAMRQLSVRGVAPSPIPRAPDRVQHES